MNQIFLRRAKRNDRLARWAISVGGISIIFCVILILLLIAKVALPLFYSASSEVYARLDTREHQASTVLAAGVDDYLETMFTLGPDGTLRFIDLKRNQLLTEQQVAPPGPAAQVRWVEPYDAQSFNLDWSDGSVSLIDVGFAPVFDSKGVRTIQAQLHTLRQWPPTPGVDAERSLVRSNGDGLWTRVDLHDGRMLTVQQISQTENFLGESQESVERFELTDVADGQITALTLNSKGTALYVGTNSGILYHWDLREPGAPVLRDKTPVAESPRPVTALSMLFGDESLVVGDGEGRLSTWFEIPDPETGGKMLRLIHPLADHDSAVVQILPSRRNKGVISLSASGKLHLDYATSERHLLSLEGLAPLKLVAANGRDNALVALDPAGEATVWSIHNPHPEVSLKTLFGKVWYEGYPEPAHVWQSSAGSDDFEPKLSLTPLIFGTFKGTFYAMLFALPMALLGAIYTSQFASVRARQLIKPAVEVMAAIPSVVIGFLAALWLAPLVETHVVTLFVSLLLLPLLFVGGLLVWDRARQRGALHNLEKGREFLLIVPLFLLTLGLASLLGPWLEQLFFAGNVRLWLFQTQGIRYDPRNCIIIALALGFAVIPIIFTIAEDALSNVPAALKAASLAVGASRWQTVWRVVLPSASPGIFAGTMIGLGRAIGETMIVLMATGNTAIMDWSPFNGMRPLSSNIAVEIPEAPVDGTLYRTLFLSAVLLFVMTFVLNTVAEIVRQRLRKKYGRF